MRDLVLVHLLWPVEILEHTWLISIICISVQLLVYS